MTARDKWVQNRKKINRLKDQLEVSRLQYLQQGAMLSGDYRLVWVLQIKINRLQNN
jgi:hypothetical protein